MLPPKKRSRGVKSFFIDDILANSAAMATTGRNPEEIAHVRPSSLMSALNICSEVHRSKSTILESYCCSGFRSANNTPDESAVTPGGNPNSALDSLISMTKETIEELDRATEHGTNDLQSSLLAFYTSQISFRRKRKTRTAFSTQQICELEKQFSQQKYLTPADRDQLASQLGLTNAQVITWFQNRRAKMKRETDELRNDLMAAKHSIIKIGTTPSDRKKMPEGLDYSRPLSSDSEAIRDEFSAASNNNSDKQQTFDETEDELIDVEVLPPFEGDMDDK